jgi:nicotinamidase-related amidase
MDDEITREINKPEKSALVVWDVQKMLVDRIFNKEEFLGNLKRLIEAARKKRIPIFFTRITPLPERFEATPRKLFFRRQKLPLTPEGLELAIAPAQDDIVVPKNTASVFIGTNFELMVRNAEITTLIFAGIATEFGIESSGRDASNRGFFTVIAKDAVSSHSKEDHERSLQNMKSLLYLMTTEEILKMWNL